MDKPFQNKSPSRLKINAKAALRYTLLPGIKPRIASLFGSGFNMLAVMVASIFQSAGLLPSNHAYLRRGMSGKFGLRHVLAEGAHNLSFNFKNIDRVFIYVAVVSAICIVGAQFFIALGLVFINAAFAAPAGYNGYTAFITTPNPADDLALRMLDMVFGIPGFFGSNELSGSTTMYEGFHSALHGMFLMYNLALLVIAVMICLYFILAVLMETAETGTPFGKRYNAVWVPIRIVVAFGLLIPISYGMNAAQFVSLHAAKWGSGFATNGWIYYNGVINSQPDASAVGMRKDMIAKPQIPEFGHLANLFTQLYACEAAYQKSGSNIKAYIIPPDGAQEGVPLDTIDFLSAANIAKGVDIHIRFGKISTAESDKGKVSPLCGDITLATLPTSEPGFLIIQEGYYNLIKNLYYGSGPTCGPASLAGLTTEMRAFVDEYVDAYITDAGSDDYINLDHNHQRGLFITTIEKEIQACVDQGIEALRTSSTWGTDAKADTYGWAFAAAKYHMVARINGAVVSMVQNVPRFAEYPLIMQIVAKENEKNKNVPPRRSVLPDHQKR